MGDSAIIDDGCIVIIFVSAVSQLIYLRETVAIGSSEPSLALSPIQVTAWLLSQFWCLAFIWWHA
jgi:hypothetical protein